MEKVTICEIDEMVINASKKYLPTVACMWDDERVELICGDAGEYMQRDVSKGSFDVIISDTSDPVGPAEVLFELPFYQCMKEALRPGGRVVTQAESIWQHLDLITKLVKKYVIYLYISFFLC